MQRERVRVLNEAAPRAGADWVLYWIQANRRGDSNHALEFAAEMANERGLPLLVYEAEYPYAGDRLRAFARAGVAEQQRRFAARGIGYVFHAGCDDALMRLAARAALVVTDDHPLAAAGPAHYAVDSSCIVPMSVMHKREWAAYSIRPKIRKALPRFLRPVEPVALRREFRGAVEGIGQASGPAAGSGGRLAAERTLAVFCEHRLRRYAREKNEPSAQATSGLSPYLHFGQISSLEVALAVKEHAERHKLIAEEFLEELIVRRELAFNFARFTPPPYTPAALPEWARRTLRKHARDRRPFLYSREEFENAATHDPLWNAAQRELLARGKIHGYYRMYWGKKILEWSRTCEEALATMIELNDRHALDGRDPNGYANILWCLGLHDRPWPERPVFGSVRYMSYEGMRRKTAVNDYIAAVSA